MTQSLGGEPDTADAIGTPAYRRVGADLRAQIADGALPVGAAVPSTAELVKHYGVSTTVVRAAINQLRHDGLLVGQPGKAVYVRSTPQALQDETIRLEDLGERVQALEQTVRSLDDAPPTPSTVSIRDDLAVLQRQVADLHAHLIELYNRIGQPYPAQPDQAHQDAAPAARRGARR